MADVSEVSDIHMGDTHAGDTHAGDTHAGDTHAGDTHAGDTHVGDSHAGALQLSAAARARMERNRLRARALQDARLVHRAPADAPAPAAAAGSAARALDSGGGFLLEPDAPSAPPRLAIPPAPVVHERDQPHCLRCDRPFPQSYLFDTFDYAVCDPCREADGDEDETEGSLELVTRTEAKSEYLLQDCDLDKRPPALRAERRRNPHRPGGADMRLYLRAQLAERALLVWGSREALDEARARREERRVKTRGAQAERRVKALRRDVRSALFLRKQNRHEHRWGAERCEGDGDSYTRACLDCGHEETYEKM